MNPEIVPYKFLVDYQNYPAGEIAGLNFKVGDRLAGSTMKTASPTGDPIVSKVCRRATPADLAAYQEKMKPQPRHKPKLVPIVFRTAVGQYRGPSNGRPGDIAGFPPEIAKQYCEGYVAGGPNGKRVGAVADYYVATIDEDLQPPPEKVEKPRPKTRRRPKRQRASMDKDGAPEKK